MSGFGPGPALRAAALVGATLVLAPAQLVVKRVAPRWRHRLPILFHRAACRTLGVRVTVEGTPPAGGGLIVANHVSWLDIPVIGAQRPLSFVAKAEVAGWPVFGWLSRQQRTLFIDRMRRGATAEVADSMGERLAAGEAVVLFAEGTTGDGTRILPLRSSLLGAVRAALGAEEGDDIPVYPLTITYTGVHGLPGGRNGRAALAWYGDTELAPHLKAMFAQGAIDVVLSWGEPIPMGRATSRKEATRRAELAIRQARRQAVTGRSSG